MSRPRLAALAVITAFCMSPVLLADTNDPPLHVAVNGIDKGDCTDSAAPCGSIDYALQRVGKNGEIRIAAGDYTLDAPADVFYLVSGAITVKAESGTTLVGVPHEFAGDLSERGIRVIADAKSLGREAASLAETRVSLQSSSFATACTGGLAGSFPCENVDLLAHIADRTPGARGADIWGFVDLNTNREYAIMGYSRGTAVYDVSDAENPREVGFVDGQSTTWRDIKIYQFWNPAQERWNAYAYVTADNASDGLFVVDLTELPHRISRVAYASDFAEAHNVYMTRTEFSTGLALTDDLPLLIIAGANRQDGRFRAYSLEDPRSPLFIASPPTPAGQPSNDRLYMHDAASMIITDGRKNTQCVNAASAPYCDVLFDFNESTIDIWDVTDPSRPSRLSRTPYANADYTHSGWLSEDKQYVFVQDETDERDRGLATTLRVFSIADLTNPSLAGTWSGPTNAIDHNGFVRGNRYYMSNYARGLTILDISNPANPVAVGRFDSYPSGDGVGFPGAWGTYPYLPSGHVLISDIDSGFYIVDDKTRNVPEGTLSFATKSFGSDETQPASISVQRNGGATGAVSVQWEVIPANGSTSDISTTGGLLNWAAGDSAPKLINVDLGNDGLNEGLERMIVRLTAPTGGATLSSPSLASLYISDPGDGASLGFLDTEIFAAERGFGSAIVVVQRTGSTSGAVSVNYAVTSGDAAAGTDYTGPASGTLSWPDGDADPRMIEYVVSDDGTGEADEFIELTLSGANGAMLSGNDSLRVNILDGTGSNAAPNAVAGQSQTVRSGVQVTLNGSGSNDPDGDVLSYNWTQTTGPAVTLNGADSPNASFTAPTVTSDTLLRFQLHVEDPRGMADSSTVGVTITTGTASGGGGGALSFWLLALLLLKRMRLDNRLFAIRSR